MLFSFLGIAQEKTESAFLLIKSGDAVTKYQFSSIKDLEENSDALLEDLPPCDTTNKKVSECSITVEFSITVTVGGVSYTVTSSITGCDTDLSTIKKRRNQLIAASG